MYMSTNIDTKTEREGERERERDRASNFLSFMLVMQLWEGFFEFWAKDFGRENG